MIPRLPPLLLAVLGGASVYGIKYALDKVEQKAIGPPGSSDHYEKVLKYRQNVKRLGIAAAVSGVIYAGYWCKVASCCCCFSVYNRRKLIVCFH